MLVAEWGAGSRDSVPGALQGLFSGEVHPVGAKPEPLCLLLWVLAGFVLFGRL